MRRGVQRAAWLFWGSIAWLGCEPASVPLEINFPSEEGFLVARTVTVHVVDADGDDPCGEARSRVVSSLAPEGAELSLPFEPCDVRDGVTLPIVGGGRRAYVVAVQARTHVVLAGCTVAEVRRDGSPVVVVLSSTPLYAEGLESNRPEPGETVMARCAGL